MEETPELQITQNSAETTEVVELPSVEEKPVKPWLKIALFSILGIIFATGLVFAGYKLSQVKQVQLSSQPTPTPAIPTSKPQPSPTSSSQVQLGPQLTPTSVIPTSNPQPSPTPSSPILNYPKPSTWKTVSIPSMNLSLCLPPKWVLGTSLGRSYPQNYIEIFFERDPNYKPNATDIETFSYTGGSRRNQYINSKLQYEYDAEKLKNETKVSEIVINGKSVLDIAIPAFPRVLVFTVKDQLVAVNRDYQPLVNDSQSVFLKDIYTIVGCIKPL